MDEFKNEIFRRMFHQTPEEKKQVRWIGIISALALVAMVVFHPSYVNKMEEENKKNYNWSYELAIENGDFQAAHKILRTLEEDVLDKKEHEKYHQIKKEKKTHWFKDDEYVVDSASIEEHNQYMEGLQSKGRAYLAGLIYVYNAEIAYVKETNENDSSKKIEHLLSELRSKLLLFKSLDMEDEAQEEYNKLVNKANGKIIDQVMEDTDNQFEDTDE